MLGRAESRDDIDAEGAIRSGANRSDLRGQFVGTHRRDADHAEAARLAYRRRQGRARDERHARVDERGVERECLGQPSLQDWLAPRGGGMRRVPHLAGENRIGGDPGIARRRRERLSERFFESP
jgi:hypothetical protein